MRKIILYGLMLSFLLCTESLLAQFPNECNTPTPDISEVMSTRTVNQILASQSRAAGPFIVRVMYHLIQDAGGTDGPTDAEVAA